LPEMIKETQELRKRRDFAIVTVAIDKQDKLADVRKLSHELKLDFPVMWWEEWKAPWDNPEFSYDGVPSAFIIDPRGTVMRNVYAGEGIKDKLACLIEHVDYLPEYKLKWSHTKLSAKEIEFTLQITNPDKQPLAVHLSASKLVWLYGEERDGKWTEIKPIPPGKKPNANTLLDIKGFADVIKQVKFDAAGQAVVTLTVPVDADAYDIDAGATIIIPGTEGYSYTTRDGKTRTGMVVSEYDRVSIKRPD
jgi:hypothetical protein